MSTLGEKDLFRIDEAAAYFSVSERTIRLWIEHRLLLTEKRNRLVWITRESILAFRLANKTGSVA